MLILSPLTFVTVFQKTLKASQLSTKASSEQRDMMTPLAGEQMEHILFWLLLDLVMLLIYAFLSYQMQVTCQLNDLSVC